MPVSDNFLKGKRISVFLEKFRRITSAGSYMPEIDGLRFIAIFWVAVWMHTTNFVNVKFYNSKLFPAYINKFILEGGHGVSFFFMISGFILALPFAKAQLQAGREVSLKDYYLRRVTRLEPPYIAALIISFAGLVFVLKKYSFAQLLPHLAASAIYCHGFIYGGKSLVLGIAWSLEVEVQFYILAPLLFLLYRIKNNVLRRSVFLALILFFTAFAYKNLWVTVPTIINSLHCFLIGMLLCDLYLTKVALPGNRKFWFISGVLLFLLSPLFLSLYDFPSYLIKHILLGLLFYIGITNARMKKLLSVQLISIIGGMCYSIYLIHLMVMSALSQILEKISIDNAWIGFLSYSAILIVFVLAASMIFYRFIEQPCMRRDWFKNIFRKKRIPAMD